MIHFATAENESLEKRNLGAYGAGFKALKNYMVLKGGDNAT